ncbi:oleosin 16 kDa [Ananas comosus]|uniref:Oleosin 16 kDa n=1 Tax=Ananas comosus TaxID=4615 RepID=A0A199VMC0_ANACO|nr:oleosin 16 kDa [Ananas comosus]OAY78219.1 Oleosin 16 kDa [Ananas comosus]
MADRQTGPAQQPSRAGRPAASLVARLQEHAPNSSQVVGFLTLVVSGAILLALTGLTLTGSVMGLVFFGPVILLSSPIWVPVAAALFVLAAGSLCACGAAVALVAGATWTYRYFTGRHPVGSGRVDYARSRIADTASHVKDYARDYGGYLQNRTKDAAPGA